MGNKAFYSSGEDRQERKRYTSKAFQVGIQATKDIKLGVRVQGDREEGCFV